MPAKQTHVGLAYPGTVQRTASGLMVADGVPVQRFLKDIISTGTYTHPMHKWKLDVTPQRMDAWIAAFRAMRENGVDVEVVQNHSLSADDVAGYVVEMFRGGNADFAEAYPEASDPNRLYAIHEMRGEDNIELARVVKNVSILVDRKFVDGRGTEYGEAITHSSIVQQPVVPGQAAFVPVAASRGKSGNERFDVFVMNLEGSTTNDGTTHKEHPMDIKELVNGIKKALGAGDDLTEENVLSRVQEHLTTNKTKADELQTKLQGLTAEVEDLKQKAASIKPVEIPPDTLDAMVETAEEQVDQKVAAGRLSPKAADLLKAEFVHTADKKPNVMMLSRAASGMDKAIFRKVLSIIDANDPKDFSGGKTGPQRMPMSRNIPGADGDDKPDATVLDARAKMAAGTAGVKV